MDRRCDDARGRGDCQGAGVRLSTSPPALACPAPSRLAWPGIDVTACMARDSSDTTPIRSPDELVAWFEAGVKPAERFRIGTEHEKFPFFRTDAAPVPY